MVAQPQNLENVPAGSGGWRFAPWLQGFVARHSRVFWALMVAWYLLSFNGLWRTGPDSALYLRVALNLASGKGYVYLGEPHRLVYPGLPYLLSWLIELSPKHYIAMADAVILAMAMGMLALCYQLFRLMVGRGSAIIATVLTAMSFHIYQYSFEILTEIPFQLGVMMVLTGGAWAGLLPAPRIHDEARQRSSRDALRGWLLLVAGLAWCAVMRPTFYLLVIAAVIAAVAAAFQRGHQRRLLALAGGIALMAGLLVVVILSDPRRSDTAAMDVYEQAITVHLQAALANPIIVLRHAWHVITPELPMAFYGLSWSPVLDPLMVLLVLGAAGWVLRRYPMGLLLIGVTLGVQLIVEPVPRYMVPVIPLLCLGWWEAAARLGRLPRRHVANGLAITMCVIYLVNPVRATGLVWLEQYRRPFYRYYHRGQYEPVRELAALIAKHTPPNAVVIISDKTKQERILTYLSGRWVVPVGSPLPEGAKQRPPFVVMMESNRAARRPFRNAGIGRFRTVATTTLPQSNGRPMVLMKASWRAAASRPASAPARVPAVAPAPTSAPMPAPAPAPGGR
jgi:hypothetical protein